MSTYASCNRGSVIDISHVKIPRVIGRNGSMISMLKKELNVSIFVGQNGRIWLKGDDKKSGPGHTHDLQDRARGAHVRVDR